MAEDAREEGAMPRRLILVGALAATAAWVAAGPAAAQEATPVVQPPTACRVAPRPAEELAAIVAVASPVPEFRSVDTAADLPQGEPADAETVAAITDAATEYAGCINAVDYPRLLALMSERSVGGVIEEWGGLAEILAETGTPLADAGGTYLIKRVIVSWVRVLPDGRVGAVVEWKGKNVGEANFEIFVWDGERWLLDDEISGFVWPEQEPVFSSEVEVGASEPTPVPVTSIPVTSEEVEPVYEAVVEAVEVDRVVYVEPTEADASLTIEAFVSGPIVDVDAGRDVTCDLFTIERGTSGATVSAQCRAAEGMIGREASLTVMASGPRGRSTILCEDTAPLAAEMVLSCTVEDPVPAA
jgi:hypothetical protein